MRIISTDWGVAYAYDQTIEMNKGLKKYPKLYKLILRHEMEHIKNPSFFDTLKIDFMDMFDFEKQSQLNKLPIKMRLQSICPIWFYKGQICTNMFYIVLYSLILIIIVL